MLTREEAEAALEDLSTELEQREHHSKIYIVKIGHLVRFDLNHIRNWIEEQRRPPCWTSEDPDSLFERYRVIRR